MQAISAPVHVKFRRKFCTVGVEFPGALSHRDLNNFSANFCPGSLILKSRNPQKPEPQCTNPVSEFHLTKVLISFPRSDAGIVVSNPTQSTDVCVCVYSVFVLFCV
jgi:hypothetical protein